jgi:hypothetical protein
VIRGTRWNNKPTRCREGAFHHSAMEAARCDELHLMQTGGLIRDLRAHPQPRYGLSVNGHDVCDYMGDFAYVDVESGEEICEDVKGWTGDTRVYQLKKKLMLACLGIEVQEVRRVRGRR